MLDRIWRGAAATAVVLIIAIGVVALPGAVLSAALVGVLLVGPAAVLGSRSLAPGSGRAVRTWALAVVATVVLSAAVAGLVVLLGAAAGSIAPMLLVLAGLWTWSRRSDLRRSLRGAPAAEDPADPGPPAPPCSRHRSRTPAEQRTSPVEEPPVVAPMMSTEQLCTAWLRTYWQLRDLPPGRRYEQVARYRGDLLDEFERRDPDGFRRWLQTSPRAAAHPGRYLPPDP